MTEYSLNEKFQWYLSIAESLVEITSEKVIVTYYNSLAAGWFPIFSSSQDELYKKVSKDLLDSLLDEENELRGDTNVYYSSLLHSFNIYYANLKSEFDSWWDNDFGEKPNILYIDEFPKEFLNYYLERKITYFINFKSKLETHFRNDYLNKALKELENLYKNVEELNNVISKIDSWKGLISRYKILKKKIENQNCLDSYWY